MKDSAHMVCSPTVPPRASGRSLWRTDAANASTPAASHTHAHAVGGSRFSRKCTADRSGFTRAGRYDTPRASVATPIIHMPPLMVRHHARLGLLSPDGGCVCCCGVIVLLLPGRVAWLVLYGVLVGAGCCCDVQDRGDSLIYLEARRGVLVIGLREISYSRAAGDRCTGTSHSADQDTEVGVAKGVDHHRRQAGERG